MKKNMKNITELTHVIRSKNAGPFELTLDMIFLDREIYEKVKKSGVITKKLIASLYNVSEEKVVTFAYFDAANAIKATLVRPRQQASIGEIDMHACQQHVPLLSIEIPW
ncbi:protein of unknown function [Proteiniborus ethanoligenes]|uniref:DUF4387 domain-containing protein n=1 Tax=Proteiniborus ethanoligenes TaxID=415015 RepID=A0A1H3L0D1_9FIRM|nr:DUF4387 domain-containing protein [Proteiniborus ethanoligenes]SDY57957.1 protein of unknown function [Proteiniborus ethanoligenes]